MCTTQLASLHHLGRVQLVSLLLSDESRSLVRLSLLPRRCLLLGLIWVDICLKPTTRKHGKGRHERNAVKHKLIQGWATCRTSFQQHERVETVPQNTGEDGVGKRAQHAKANVSASQRRKRHDGRTEIGEKPRTHITSSSFSFSACFASACFASACSWFAGGGVGISLV